MRIILCFGLCLLTASVIMAQTAIVDSVHPYFGEALDWRRIREKYQDFYLGIGTRKVKRSHNHVTLSIFHSNALFINTGVNDKEKLSELRPFERVLPPNQGFAIMGKDPNAGGVAVFDSLPVFVTAYGIDERNRNDFKYRVVLNREKEIVTWIAPRFFTPVMLHYQYNADGTEQKEMAYLGMFKAPVGSSITIEVKNIHYSDTIYKVSAVWVKRAPEVMGVFNAERLKDLITVYKYQWKYDFQNPNSSYYGDFETKPVDSLLKITKRFENYQNNILLYLKDKVKTVEMVEYCLIKNGDSLGWSANKLDPNIISLVNLEPADYTLLMRYAFQRQTISAYNFSIKRAWYQTTWFKIMACLLSLLAASSIFFFIKNRIQKSKLKEADIKRQVVQAEIKSIKSQFNPHFVFNSLNSIQGLITKNEINLAYQYLTDFSTLLRNSLKESEREWISLSKDIQLIKNYLKLEQLRFGFQYKIEIAPDINEDAVEVPVLLLQPVIENAVKHGVAGLYANGQITISYKLAVDDLQVTVKDNGSGYDPVTVREGYGQKLTRERIGLINQTLNNQEITWNLTNSTTGTTAIFIFKNWLL